MNKYLEKVAKLTIGQSTGIGALAGAGLGGFAGYQQKSKRVKTGWFKTKEVKLTQGERILGSIGGALGGAYVGAAAGMVMHPEFKKRRAEYHSGGSRSAGNTRTSRTIRDIHSDIGFKSAPKTKAEATAHFRRERSKHHPDRYQGPEKSKADERMAKLNRAWDEFQAHPEGFTKLANAYLTKIAAIDVNKIRRIVKANPGAAIGGVLGAIEGGSSTLKLKREGQLKYRLRQTKNTIVGAGFGAATGKFIQEGLKSISK